MMKTLSRFSRVSSGTANGVSQRRTGAKRVHPDCLPGRHSGTSILREIVPAGTRRCALRLGVLGTFTRALLFVLVLGSAVSPLEAQRPEVPGRIGSIGTPQTEAVARSAMAQLRSPVTPSHTLDMCPNAGVEALRDTIRWAAAEGQSADEIVEGVIARYGADMRIVPERRGVGLWAWVMPPVVLLAGGGLLFARLRRLRQSGPEARNGEPDDGLSDDEREQLDAALAELEASEEEPV
jgi:cytochrome c-type biogenesis protein CcmH